MIVVYGLWFLRSYTVSEIKETTDFNEENKLIKHNEWILLSVAHEEKLISPIIPSHDGKSDVLGIFKYSVGKTGYIYHPPKKL